MSAVKKGMGSVSKYLVGNGDTSTERHVEGASPEEDALRNSILGSLNDLYDQNAPDQGNAQLNNLFQTSLTNYLSQDMNGKISPELAKSASGFVDQTFTNPQRNALDQYARQYSANTMEMASQMGRSPLDASIQQNQYRTLADLNQNIETNRDAQIAKRMDYIGFQRPTEGMNFINALNQKAMSNRYQLLNAKSSLMNNAYITPRLNNQTTTNRGPDQGILGSWGSINQGLGSISGLTGQTQSGLTSIGGGLSDFVSKMPMGGSGGGGAGAGGGLMAGGAGGAEGGGGLAGIGSGSALEEGAMTAAIA
jgi:hypothetical protein